MRTHNPAGYNLPTQVTLANALTKRNFLAHHFFRERSDEFLSQDGREKMIAELQDAQALFETADAMLYEATRPARERYGFTEERIEQMIEERLRTISLDL